MPITVYSWSDFRVDGLNNLRPMTWARHIENSGQAWGESNADSLKNIEPGHRSVLFFNANSNSFDITDPVRFFREGPYTIKWENALRAYYTAMKGKNMQPDRVILDIEQGCSIWHLGANKETSIRSIWEDPTCYANLPSYLKQYTPANFIWGGPDFRNAYVRFNYYAAGIKREAIRKTIIHTYRSVYGSEPYLIVGNYGDMRLRFPILDQNGWPWRENGRLSEESCPVTYLGMFGQKFARAQKHIGWNCLIDCVNLVRTCMVEGKRAPTPWVTYPGWAGDYKPEHHTFWLWEQVVRHHVAAGVNTFLYWGPKESTVNPHNHVFANDLWGSLSPSPRRYDPFIPIDADEIVSGSVRTTYQDYVDNYLNIPVS